jgi:hypothetical protein
MKNRILGFLAVLTFLSLLWLSGKYMPGEPVETTDVAFLADTTAEPVYEETNLTMSFAEYVAHKRSCITDWMDNELGLREKSENNHPRIHEYFSNLGWKNVEKLKAHSKRWCGVFVANAWLSCIGEIPWTKSNAALAQVAIWKKGPAIQKKEAKAGDVISLVTHSHVEGVYDRHPNPEFPYFTAVGGNTSAPPGDADRREGVHKKTRTWAEVNKVISLEQTLEMIENKHIS